MFRPEWPAEQLPGFASQVERLGFDELWVVEDCFSAGGFTLASAALAATTSLKVGIGLLPTTVRNPAITAMEIAALARIFPSRLVVAFGHGVESWMIQIGARPANRLRTLAEVVTAVRELLEGKTVSMNGTHVSLANVALEHPPAQPPSILIGTTGQRGLELAGTLAGGVLLPEGATASAIRWVRQTTTALDPDSRTTTYAWLCLDDDRALAGQRMLPDLRNWCAQALYPELRRRAPLPLDPLAALPEPDLLAALDAMAIIGEPHSCAAALRRLSRAGADSIVLRPMVADGHAEVERFGSEVLPLLGRTHLI